MEWMDPPDCAPISEENPDIPWRIFADDGMTILTRITARECFVPYMCWLLMYYNFYPGNTNITARREPADPQEPVEPPQPDPEIPPVEPDPV